jgi:hypothetical protein
VTVRLVTWAERPEVADLGPPSASTVPWSVALHDAASVPDGLCWRSRQPNDSLASMLFGSRVAEADLAVVRAAESLALRPGGDLVYEFAEAADIAIIT